MKTSRILMAMMLVLILAMGIVACSNSAMGVADFILDFDSEALEGKTVTVQGYIAPGGGMTILFDEIGSTSFVSIDTESLPRETKKDILKCVKSCHATVTGIADTGFLGKEIIAESIEID